MIQKIVKHTFWIYFLPKKFTLQWFKIFLNSTTYDYVAGQILRIYHQFRSALISSSRIISGPLQADPFLYRMSRTGKKLLIIISIKRFRIQGKNLPDRNETDKDVESLYKLFQRKLGFTCNSRSDQTSAGMTSIMIRGKYLSYITSRHSWSVI